MPQSQTSTPRRRLLLLGGLLAAAAVIVVAAILISRGNDDNTSTAKSGPSASLLAGIPQDGTTLGKADAPVTIVEFADPQCPFCKQFASDELPAVIRDQVRTGKAKLQLQMLTFLGPDSLTAGRVLEA